MVDWKMMPSRGDGDSPQRIFNVAVREAMAHALVAGALPVELTEVFVGEWGYVLATAYEFKTASEVATEMRRCIDAVSRGIYFRQYIGALCERAAGLVPASPPKSTS